ncbi:MAG: alpha-ketoacid dehydrogenase subunit beta [Thaumarchaeota archaeon]|nr:MAG: alpha-ketoacid dehydrogenase subunit beta [Nitrososphaerota archaeon]
MREITYLEAINEALREAMEREKKVFLMGEQIGAYGGAFKVTSGLLQKFGPERVMDTPISEAAIVGAAVGASLLGLKPVAEIMYMDFMPLSMDQLVTHAAKLHYFSGGQLEAGMILRTQYSLGRAHGAQHSGFLPAWFLQAPGLKVAVPSTPYDAKGLLNAALKERGPVLFVEGAMLYKSKGEVPEGYYEVPFGQAEVKRGGKDITVVAISRMVPEALATAESLASSKGIEVEVVDPRTIQPLDKKTIVDSVKKTGRLVVASDDMKTGGVGAEIGATVFEEAIDYLKAPLVRVCSPDIPVPFAPPLEREYMPNAQKLEQAIEKLFP